MDAPKTWAREKVISIGAGLVHYLPDMDTLKKKDAEIEAALLEADKNGYERGRKEIDEAIRERDLAREMLLTDQTHASCDVFQKNQQRKLDEAIREVERLKELNAKAKDCLERTLDIEASACVARHRAEVALEAEKRRTAAVPTVICEVMAERARQDSKWGEQNHDPFKYLAILGEEVGEANKAAVEAFDFKSGEHEVWSDAMLGLYREELIQVAAVAVAMVECLDRRKWQEDADAEAQKLLADSGGEKKGE